MAKLYFYWGAMNSAKTMALIASAYNYRERGLKVIIFKPKIDNREASEIKIKSRCGIESDAIPYDAFYDFSQIINDLIKFDKIDRIFIDESQFLTKKQVIGLSDVVDNLGISIVCYGLKNNFKGELFEGSKWLFSFSDEIKKISSVCWCGEEAEFNARVINGEVIKEGNEIQIGGNDIYSSLCRKHWKSGQVFRDKGVW